MSKTLAIEMNDDVFPALQAEPEQMAREMQLISAVKWYELGRVSQSKAAEIAGLSRAAFIAALSRFGVSPFQETADEILQIPEYSHRNWIDFMCINRLRCYPNTRLAKIIDGCCCDSLAQAHASKMAP